MTGIMSVSATFTVPAQTAKAPDAKSREAWNYNKTTAAKDLQAGAIKNEIVRPVKKDILTGKIVADNLSTLTDNSSRKNNQSKEQTALERYNNRSLSLDVDTELNIVVARIIDKESGEVVRQIPPEQKVELMKFLKEHPGTLFSRHS